MCMSSIKKISLTGNGLLLLLAFPFISFSQLQAKLIPKKGLIINQGSLQWAMGSEINFLNENRKQHEYYLPGGNKMQILAILSKMFYLLAVPTRLFKAHLSFHEATIK